MALVSMLIKNFKIFVLFWEFSIDGALFKILSRNGASFYGISRFGYFNGIFDLIFQGHNFLTRPIQK
jgi:hypothetical protein